MSGENQRVRDLLHTLAHSGFKRDRSETKAFSYKGQIKVVGHAVNVSVTFPDLEFTQLPKLTLLNPEQETPQVVAHLGASGAFCFARNEGLVLDRYDVGGTALTCLALARRGLEHALTHQHLENEISQEFPQHWLGTPFYYDVANASNREATLYRVSRRSSPDCFLLTDRKEVLRRLLPHNPNKDGIEASSLPAFVFHSDVDLTFKRSYSQPQTLADFLEWLGDTLPNTRNKVLRQLTHFYPQYLLAPLFISAPNGCVGILVDASLPILQGAQSKPGLQRIVLDNAHKLAIQRVSGSRVDLPFIFKRNMKMHVPLTGRRIAIVGCGTIGSHLAKFLVQSGAGHEGGTLLLIDNQPLEPGNVGRHYLGTPSIGEQKVDALKQELLRQYPDSNILPRATNATNFLDPLAGYDLVLDATGEEALSVSINHHFVTRRLGHKQAPAVVHVYLYGNGAAAQALLVDGLEFACFKCLKPDHGGQWRFSPMKPNTPTIQTPAACGEAQFTAYGVAAPAMAAAMALQVSLDWNSGKPAPRLRTMRFEKEETIEVADKNPSPFPRCPACGEKAK